MLVIDGAHFDELVRKAVAGDIGQLHKDVEGAIVWVEPYAATLQPVVDSGVDFLRRAGAVRVVVLPRATADEQLPAEQVRQAAEAFATGPALVRQVAEDLAMALSIPDWQKARALEVVSKRLDGVGL